MDATAIIYIILAVILTLLFMLTRYAILHVKRDREFLFGIDFTFLGFEVRWDGSDTEENKSDEDVPFSPAMLGAVRSVIKRLLRFISNCSFRIRCIRIPQRKQDFSWLSSLRLIGAISALYVFADSKTRGITVENNALILDSDTKSLEFDVAVRVMLLELLILAIGLLFDTVKIGKMEKSNVGN